MDSASVSVVIPCYRCAATIKRAVDSVARQTVVPQEIILVDDGSGDDTLPLLLDLQSRYSKNWVRVLSQKQNCGVSTARNVGWDESASDYVAFLDADDAWHERKIEIQYRWMVAHSEVAFSGHGSILVDPTAQPVQTPVAQTPPVRLLSKCQIVLSNPFTTPSFMIRRDVPYRFDVSQKHTEDFLLLMQIRLDGHLVAKIGADLAIIFKIPGKTGASRHIWRMRAGDLINYRKLWRSNRLGFSSMCLLSFFSILKFAVMLSLGAGRHSALKTWLDR